MAVCWTKEGKGDSLGGKYNLLTGDYHSPSPFFSLFFVLFHRLT